MLDQAEKEGQVVRVHPLLVEREDEGALRGADQVVRVLDAFGDALGGEELADAVARHEGGHLVIGHFGIDGHDRTLLLELFGRVRRRLVAQLARQREEDVLVGGRNGLDANLVARGEGIDDLLDQHLGRACAGGDAEAADLAEDRPVDLVGAQDEPRDRAAGALGDLAQALRIRGIGRTDDDQPCLLYTSPSPRD